MKINKLVLNNFSSFENENVIDFTLQEKDKNIILIGGQNGAGKTSLFTAIKIALYGPLAFGYSGSNTYYIQKIKEYINSKAYQKAVVEASVIIDVSLMVEREVERYSIERRWDYSKQRLEEFFTVKKEDKILGVDEVTYFQNYLQTVIPPGLFDFFLFDGEEVGNIFSSNTYNTFIKKALFTIYNLDVFELVRKNTSNYLVKSDESEEKEATEVYNKNKKLIEELQESIITDENKFFDLNMEIQDLELELEELEQTFKKAGGITEEEKKIILSKINLDEKRKNELSGEIKSFMDGLAPFFVVEDYVKPILKQIDQEEKQERFIYISEKLDRKAIDAVLKKNGIMNSGIANEICEKIVSSFRPENNFKDVNVLHDLSKDQKNRVYAVTSSIDGFNKKVMLKKLKEKQLVTSSAAHNRGILKSAMSEEDSLKFTEKENTLLKQIAAAKNLYAKWETLLENKKVELKNITDLQEQCYQEILDKAQNRNIYRLTNGISKIMNKVLASRLYAIKRELEKKTVENLKKIYRKDNLITHIEIDEDFRFNLYQNETYSASNLVSLIKNYGQDEFKKLIGKSGEETLYDYFAVKNIKQLQTALNFCNDNKQIELYKRIDLSRLSKGERQIFILSLYWAIIKLSDQRIPFIIDTPYARIDASHREAISSKFFPDISEQVIILSTDEEINEESYRKIKPYIAKEYLLTNDANENRTTILNKYFYEV